MEEIKVRCGQCVGCRLDHSSMWAIRAMHESKSHEDTCFVTLTYDDENMPEDRSVSKRPIQIFFKSLRNHLTRNQPGKKIKYIACGEYTEKKTRPIGPFNPWEYIGEGQRPHYHAIIFGIDFHDKKLWSVRNGNRIYTSDVLTNIWGQGHCTVGAVTYESAAYVARYSLKKINGSLKDKPDEITGLLPYERTCQYTGQIIEVEQERFHTSNGLGKEFYEKYKTDIYPQDRVIVRQHETRPPRYYDYLFDAEEPNIMEEIKNRRIIEMQKHEADNTPARLRDREKVKLAQLKQLKRVLE